MNAEPAKSQLQFFTLGQAAALLGVPAWRLAYLVARGDVERPANQVPGRRLFTADEVKRIEKQLLAHRSGPKRDPRAAPVKSPSPDSGRPLNK